MVNKSTLAKELKKSNLPYAIAVLCIDSLFESMRGSLSRGEHIEIRGFGTFYIAKRAPRQMNINGQKSIPAHGKVMFRPCKKLRKAVWIIKET